jgi:hypothetical protein
VGRLAAVALVALACAGVALASGGEPRKQHTAADVAKARAAVLKAADLGAGWRSKPAGSDSGTPRCKGFRPDESDLIETGSADSPEFDKGVRYVSSSAAVYKTAAQAQASWDRVVKPGLLDCLGSIFDKGATGSNVTVKTVGKRALAFPKLAPRSAAYRLNFTAKTQGLTLRGAVDLILLGKGRMDAVMISVSFGTPPIAEERRLAGLIAGRFS